MVLRRATRRHLVPPKIKQLKLNCVDALKVNKVALAASCPTLLKRIRASREPGVVDQVISGSSSYLASLRVLVQGQGQLHSSRRRARFSSRIRAVDLV